MAKTLQFRDGSEDGPTGKYLLAVTHEAHRRLAPDQAEGVVAEVRDHLTAQIETQVMSGIARSNAERDAVRCFGSAHDFVRGVSISLHDTRRAQIVRDVTFAIAVLTLVGCFLYYCRLGPSPWASEYLVITGMLAMLILPVATLVIGSWLGWQATVRRYAVLGAGFILAVVLWTGFDTFTLAPRVSASETGSPRQYSRSYMRRATETATLWRDMARADVEQLEAGLSAFQVGARRTDSAAVVRLMQQRYELMAARDRLRVEAAFITRERDLLMPGTPAREKWSPKPAEAARMANLQSQITVLDADVRQMEALAHQRNSESALKVENSAAIQAFRTPNGTYIAPRTFEMPNYKGAFVSVPRWHTPSRGTYESAVDYARRYRQFTQETPPVQFKSFGQAQRRWMDNGPLWLKRKKQELAAQEQALETCRRVEAAPLGFNGAAVGRLLLGGPTLVIPFALILLNAVPAALARLTRRTWDRWIWRIRSTT